MISNYELFEQFFNDCKQKSIEEVIKEYGGGHIYIPSYKKTHRNQKIYELYNQGATIKELKIKFNLSESRIRKIIRKEALKNQN